MGPATRRVSRCPSATVGLYEAEETPRRASDLATEGNQAGIRGTGCAVPHTARRVCDRVRVLEREQDANPVEGHRATRLDNPAAGLAGNGRMIQITAQMRVLVAIEAVDGRKGIDSLARLCQEKLAEDPFSGCVFVFRSRSGTAIRLLSYDGQGYWLAQKRLSKGRFVWWPEATGPTKPLEAYEAQLLMAAGDLSRVRAAPMGGRGGVLKRIPPKMRAFTPCVPRKSGSYCGRWSSAGIGAGRSARKTSFIYARWSSATRARVGARYRPGYAKPGSGARPMARCGIWCAAACC